MGRPIVKVPELDERTAQVKCHQLVSRFLPAWDGLHSSPVIVELTDAHAAVSKELARLAGVYFSYAVVLTELAGYVGRYRCPVLDSMRERNGLETTFGEQVVSEVVR